VLKPTKLPKPPSKEYEAICAKQTARTNNS
jgi:large subunit ribosomal protein L23Ae